MSNIDYLTNHFLIAMPALKDPNFFQSVTYICEHNANGALGIIINRPLDLSLPEILAQASLPVLDNEASEIAIHLGGPVQQDRGLVIHEPLGEWNATMKVTSDIGITSSIDILEAIAKLRGPERCLIALGYAGWGAGQLEHEMAENAWLNGPADPDILFNTPNDERWKGAAMTLGVDLDLLSGETGHA